MRGENFVVSPNTAGREGYIFEQTFTNPIGTNNKGKPLYNLKVVIDEAGNVITAFPQKQEVVVMNFYIGNSIDEIDEQDVNVEFSDELIDFIYKMSGQVSFDMSKLYQIDPYDDVEVSKNDLSQIVEICKYILDTALLRNYEEPDEGRQMVQDLLEIIKKAMTRDLGLVSIGD